MIRDKLKILYLMKLLLEETDAAHPLNASQICERLEAEQGSDPLFLWQTRLRILRCMMQETGVCYHMRQRWRCCLRSQSNYNE